MRAFWLLLMSGLLLTGCSSRPRDAGPVGEGPDKAQIAAGRAFAELEGGEAVPLPGMEPAPAGVVVLEEETDKLAAEAHPGREMDYTVRPGWFLVDTSLVFPASVAPQMARQEALQVARIAGLEQALPPTVSFTSLLSDIMDETAGAAFEKSTWSTFALSSATGHLVDEKILSADLQPMEGNAYRYRIVLEARVEPVKGARDPSLHLDLEMMGRKPKIGQALCNILQRKPED